MVVPVIALGPLTPIQGSHIPHQNLTDNVWQVVTKHFDLVSNICLFTMGAKELIMDHVIWDHNLEKEKVQSLAHPQIRTIQKVIAQYTLVHGVLFYSSGVFGAFATLEKYFPGLSHTFSQTCQWASYGLFFLVNVYSIERNLRVFQAAEKMMSSTTSVALKMLAYKLQVSAFLGVLNNLGYMVATIFTIFPGLEAVTITCALFALLCGSIKIIFDLFWVTPEIVPKKS